MRTFGTFLLIIGLGVLLAFRGRKRQHGARA